MKLKSVNPYTEKVNWTYDSFSIGECRARIEKSRAAFSLWGSLPVEEKAKYFKTAAEILRENTDTYAEIITKEMGKTVRQSKNEVQKCVRLCDYYAKNAAELLKDEIVDIGTEKSYVTFEPLGVIFGIMLKSHNKSIISEVSVLALHPTIVKVTVDNHFSDRL